ncbi:hypothetical protein [Moraxella lacunata]
MDKNWHVWGDFVLQLVFLTYPLAIDRCQVLPTNYPTQKGA